MKNIEYIECFSQILRCLDIRWNILLRIWYNFSNERKKSAMAEFAKLVKIRCTIYATSRNHDRKAYMRSVYYTLNVRSLGKPVSFVFSLEFWCFPRLRLGKHQDSRENKTNCFRRDLTLSLYYYICKFGLSILHIGIRCIFDKANPSVINVFVFW